MFILQIHIGNMLFLHRYRMFATESRNPTNVHYKQTLSLSVWLAGVSQKWLRYGAHPPVLFAPGREHSCHLVLHLLSLLDADA